MADQSLFNTSGIPVLLGMAAVNTPRCIECASMSTWTLPSLAPFTNRPMLSRLCDNCGRVTAGYEDEGITRNVEENAPPTRPAGPYLRARR